MTRRRDLMCEDLFSCDHQPTVPISDDGQIVEWRCRCGRVRISEEPRAPAAREREPSP